MADERNYHHLEAALSRRYGLDVIISDALPSERVLLVSRDTMGRMYSTPTRSLFLKPPLDPRWEAVQIVQEGMADIVAWLRAAGHDMPDAYVQQADHKAQQERYRRAMAYGDAAFPVGRIIEPRSFVTVVMP